MKKDIVLIARKLRKNQTETESILWNRLKNRKFLNIKFLRQHPISFQIEDSRRFFIADFYCYEKKLVIELDGEIHKKQKELDQFRDLILDALGIKVIRVNNIMIMDNIEYFLSEVLTPLLFPREGAGG
jgi:very-short-patch-repair endonuclease